MRRRRGPGLIGTAVVVGGAAHMGAKSAQKSQAAAAQPAAPPPPAEAPPPPPPPAVAAVADPVEELQKLADMKAQGILTDEEFATMKAKILAS